MKYAVDNDMIDLSYVQEQYEMNKRKELFRKNPWEPFLGNDGYWHCYIPDKIKKRRQIKRKSRADIEELIIEFWKEEEENPTITDVFNCWINQKLEYEEISQATYIRYKNDYQRFFLDDRKFGEKRIKKVDEEDIETFVKQSIVKHKLTTKSFGNLRTLLYGIFRKGKKYVDFSITLIVKDMEISSKSFKKVVKEDESEVFSEDEYPVVIQYLLENQDIINLGILLLFSTGMRVGELATLKHSDYSNGEIKIRRTETIYKDGGKNVYAVKEFPKTEAGLRGIVIPTSDLWILKKIKQQNPFGVFMFEREGERIKALFFRKRLYSICKKIGIKPKSPHKIRKTYGSILLDNNVDQRLILSQMGHADILCTENHYHRNRKSIERKKEILDNISELCIMN